MRDKWLRATEDHVSEAGLDSTSLTVLPPGSLLVTTRATIGEVAIAAVPVTTNQGFKSLVPAADNDSVFLFYLLRAVSPEMRRLASGSTFDEISKADFSSITVALPALAEQRRIAEILDTVDRAIRHTQAIIAKLEQVKAGLLHDLLTRGLDENGELRNPERHPEQFKDSPLGRIPREWEVRRLQSLLTGPISYGVLKPGPYVSGGVPLLRIVDTSDNVIDTNNLHRISTELDEQYSRTRLDGGELVLSLVGTVGQVALVPPELRGANISRALAVLRVDQQQIEARALRSFLLSEQLQRVMHSTMRGNAQKVLNIGPLRKIEIPVPPKEEQRRIAVIFERMAERESLERAALAKLSRVKKALMQDLLTGRVRVAANEPVTTTA